jgi:hypothetical protein
MVLVKMRWGQELRDPVKNAVGLFLVREVAGVGITLMLKIWNRSLKGCELQGGAKLVAVSLQNKDGAGDAWEKFAEREDFVAKS